MARIRSLKPEFWHDRKLARSCSRDARMLYAGLWNHADEHGRANGDPAVVKGQVFPYDDVDVAALLGELKAARRVLQYDVDGDPYLFLPKLAEHQRLDTAKVASKFPEPPAEFPDSDDRVTTATSSQVTGFPDESEKNPDESENHGSSSALLYGTGSMDQGTGNASRPDAADALPDKPRTDTQRSKTITDAYADAEPMCRWPAVNGVVLRAIRSGKFTDTEIHAAVLRLAAEGRSVTVETLRVELAGLPTGRASPTKAQQRTASNLSVISRLEAQNPQHREIS